MDEIPPDDGIVRANPLDVPSVVVVVPPPWFARVVNAGKTNPTAPVGPVRPVVPVKPVGPVTVDAAPVGPVRPVGPVGPVRPVEPGDTVLDPQYTFVRASPISA